MTDLFDLPTPPGPPSAGVPAAVSVVHYGPDGTSVARTGTATVAASGAGTSVGYSSAIAGGQPASTSTLSLDSSGRPTSASTSVLGADGSVSQQLATDYSGLTYNGAGFPVEGAVNVAVTGPDEQPLHQAQMQFANEQYQTYHVTSYDPTDGQTVVRSAHVDFAQATIVANRLVGGQLMSQYFRGDGSTSSTSVSHLTREGVPSMVEATNFEPDGVTARLGVQSNYAGVSFDPRRQVGTGKLVVATTTPAGAPHSATVFTYHNGLVIGRAPYTASMVIPEVVVGPSNAPSPWSPTTPADATTELHRPDGSLLQRVETWYQPGSSPPAPRRMKTTGYALDGVTVVRETDTDYSGARFDPSGAPNGGTVVSTQFVAGVRASVTNTQY